MSETPCSRAAALENPALSGTLSPNPCSRAAALENPAKLFEKSLTKTLVARYARFENNVLFPREFAIANSHKSFLSTFFKKVGGVKGRQPLSRIVKGGSS